MLNELQKPDLTHLQSSLQLQFRTFQQNTTNKTKEEIQKAKKIFVNSVTKNWKYKNVNTMHNTCYIRYGSYLFVH